MADNQKKTRAPVALPVTGKRGAVKLQSLQLAKDKEVQAEGRGKVEVKGKEEDEEAWLAVRRHLRDSYIEALDEGAVLFEVVLNGGGQTYWIRANELGRILEAWCDGSVGRAVYVFNRYPYQDTGSAADLGTSKYIDHGFGYLFLDFEQLSAVSIVGTFYK